MTDNQHYDASQIKLLDPIEHIRLRPGMYIGGTDVKALHHLVFEVVHDALQEVLAGQADHITVTLFDDNGVSVSDNGFGLPVDITSWDQISLAEIVMTNVLWGKSCFRVDQPINAGIFGMGLQLVNALCKEAKIEVKRDGYLWEQSYSEGKRQTDLINVRELQSHETTGTTLTFKPDFTIFSPNNFSYQTLARAFRQLAFLTPNLTITLDDKRSQPEGELVHFHYANNLSDLVAHLNRDFTPIHQPIHARRKVAIAIKDKPPFTVEIEFALQYIKENDQLQSSFANLVETSEGGPHVNGFISALATFIRSQHPETNQWSSYFDDRFAEADFVQGLTSIITIIHPDVQLKGFTIAKLLNPEVKDVVHKVVLETIEAFANAHPDEMRRIVERCLANRDVREKRRG